MTIVTQQELDRAQAILREHIRQQSANAPTDADREAAAKEEFIQRAYDQMVQRAKAGEINLTEASIAHARKVANGDFEREWQAERAQSLAAEVKEQLGMMLGLADVPDAMLAMNPYGVAFVPQGFPSGGALNPGDLLVSDFNNEANVQGTGSTILRYTPAGGTSVFFQGMIPAPRRPSTTEVRWPAAVRFSSPTAVSARCFPMPRCSQTEQSRGFRIDPARSQAKPTAKPSASSPRRRPRPRDANPTRPICAFEICSLNSGERESEDSCLRSKSST